MLGSCPLAARTYMARPGSTKSKLNWLNIAKDSQMQHAASLPELIHLPPSRFSSWI